MKPMKLFDLVRLLESHGFTLIRSKNHMVYAKGSTRIALAHQRMASVGVVRSTMKAIEQANNSLQMKAA